MAIFDFKATEFKEGEFDIDMPLVKVTAKEDLLFQQVDLLLNTYTEEFLYDITLGMPYDEILKKDFDLTSLESLYYAKISVLIYFKDIQDFLLDIDENRNYNVTLTVIAENEASQTFSVGV